jgi:predicted porin
LNTTKSGLATAAVLALTCLPASAQGSNAPTLYGTVDGGFYVRQLAGEARVSRVDGGMLTTSRWGIRGSEDLGGGLSALFDLGGHFRLDTGEVGRHPGDNAAGRFFSRYSFVGLRGAFGQVRAGRIPTGSFVHTLSFTPLGDSTTLGPFMLHTFVGSQPMLASHGTSDGSWNNSLVYNTPTLGGWSGALQYAPAEAGPEGRRFDGTLNHRSGAWAAALSVSRIRAAAYNMPRSRTDPAGTPYVIEAEASNLGSVSYDFGVVKVFGQWARATLRPRGQTEIQLDTVGAHAAVPWGAGRFIASWARTERTQAGVAGRERTTLAAGYLHSLSRRIDAYAVVLSDRATGLRSGTGYAIGMRHHF